MTHCTHCNNGRKPCACPISCQRPEEDQPYTWIDEVGLKFWRWAEAVALLILLGLALWGASGMASVR